MPSGPIKSLYGIVAGEESYFSAAFVLCTAPLLPGNRLGLADLGEPSVSGYGREEAATVREICYPPIIVPGESVSLTSKFLDWINDGPTPVNITGLALVVWKDRFTPVVMVTTPAPCFWRPGMRIRGRYSISANIYDQRP